MALGAITARDALDSALIALRAAGVESPRLDAELLVARACGVDRAALVCDPELVLPADAIAPLRESVRRRALQREPLAYVLGSRHFRHIELAVDHRVLIPRPETELLVEVALGLPHGARVLDVGTGSGAVALALADERSDLVVAGSDSSEDALAVARANAARLGLDVAFAAGDLLAPLHAGLLGGRVDAVVCNPPYVADRDRLTLAPEIVRHEPAGALFAGHDGLQTIRRLVAQAGAARIAWLALEVGAGQADAVTALMCAAGYAEVETHPDLAFIPRVLTAARVPA